MAKKLTSIEGVGEGYAEKLGEAGIKSVETLLERGATPQSRAEIVAQTGLSQKLITRWVNCADLFRIKGIGGQYAELLEAAGVDTVPELAQRNPHNLSEKMKEVNQEKKLVRQPPTETEVSRWIVEAKELPRAVSY